MNKFDRRHTCKHFNGLQNETCEAGVRLHDVRDISRPGMATWPCLDVTCPTTCEQREEWTDHEYAEGERRHNASVALFVGQVVAFEDRTSEDCPHCGRHVESLSRVGRCVYARPCHCRLGQGSIPAAWAKPG